MSGPSLTSFIVKRPWLNRWFTPIAQWHNNLAGYRQLGLKYDDLLPEESEAVQTALKRLPAKEAYDRVFRIRRAFQCSISHTILPPNEHIKPEEDNAYLTPIIRAVEKEIKERKELDSLTVKKK
ncbi:Cytochrome b-c1 complex subunit 7 [Penicillium capsulatum]|uniref:Cytochrome b-c1 complex subunit 7 n=1 Tax=Penicillium capsulatum TaxID=69766 RepID=A0A9W9LW61_9EURO|nr:Cytochrome b-c1 complex subunit 7 [Penicillium capsulatum]KAJ6122444.1 Cytochrome b-c1 complex subunit 7 [Penicillium capsulatum]